MDESMLGGPPGAESAGRAKGVGPLGHELEQLGRRQGAGPRRRQLDGQRQAVDRHAELGHRLHRALGSIPAGVAAGDQLEEEGDGRCGSRIRVGGGRKGERVQHHDALARHAEGLAAGGEHGAVVGRVEEPQGEVHGAREHVVAAVEDDDDPFARGGQRQCLGRAHPRLAGDRGRLPRRPGGRRGAPG